MWALLLVLIVLLFVVIRARERFGLIIGTPDWWSFNTNTDEGYEVFSTWPNTCKANKPDLQAGLCYEKCRAGFYGVGPVCWAKTETIGVGKPVGLEPCPDGWSDAGLICAEPLKCGSGWDFFKEGCSGGRLRGRLNNGGICDWPEDRSKLPSWLRERTTEIDPTTKRRVRKIVATHPDRVDGMCYKKCPKEYPKHVPLAPYLCYKGGDLSYTRGIGEPPTVLRIGRIFHPF